jgi:hypothetical protein
LFTGNQVGYAPAVDAIQEFNEITLNATAEFGNFMGGIIRANNWKGAARSDMRWNNFGGTFGEPIRKDKLFAFLDYQGSRDDTPTTINSTTVYTSAERQGDFSQLLTQAKPVQLYNPFSLDASGVRAPFPGNIIPNALISPAAGKFSPRNTTRSRPTAAS